MEKKTGDIRTQDGSITITDLPGVYSLSDVGTGLDERIAEVSNNSNSDQRCVSSYLKQLVKTKRQQLAALKQQNS